MSSKKKQPLNIQNLFELRKIKSTEDRVAMGRIFEADSKLGLCDASGCIWPIAFQNKQDKKNIKNGDVITFTYHAICKNEGTESYLIEVKNILNTTLNYSSWNNPIIPSPIPTMESLLAQDHAFASHSKVTKYYKSPAQIRNKTLVLRNKAIERAKKYFCTRGFQHIETPTLVPSGGFEVYLNLFNTLYIDHRGQKIPLQLPTSPEFALKKFFSEGHDNIFQISRAYRNCGELSKQHEPEFLMLEWYRKGVPLRQMMDDTQSLVLKLADFLGSLLEIPKQWNTFRVDELFLKLLNLNLLELQDTQVFLANAKPLSQSIVPNDDWDSIFCKLFMEKIEPFLKEQNACFVTHYPIQMGALAAQETEKTQSEHEEVTKKTKPYVERFEAYLHGVEICNGYLELVDAQTLTKRFEHTFLQRGQDLQKDIIFEKTIQFALPPCSGNALGLDRVIALLLGENQISNLYPIPFLSQFSKNTVAPE